MPFSKAQLLIGAGVAVLTGAVIVFFEIFTLSGGDGETFAPYSSFRPDPLGTMALYHAVERLPNRKVERYMGEFDRLPHGEGETLIVAGAALGEDPVPVLQALEAFMVTGGRLVIAFYPQTREQYLNELRRAIADEGDEESPEEIGEDREEIPPPDPAREGLERSDGPPRKRTAPAREDEEDAGDPASDDGKDEGDGKKRREFGPGSEDISVRWDFDYGFELPEPDRRQVLAETGLALGESQPSMSGLYFIPVSDKWRVIYRPENEERDVARATIMERKFGAGSVVLCSDAYPLSNEALRHARDARLLAWILGDSPSVRFSETHLGTQQRDRIMTLMRRYRLHGMIAAFAVLGLLFVWHHGSSLVPRRAAPARRAASTAAQRSHGDGLDNLIARYVPRSELLSTCVREWMHHFQHEPRSAAVARALESVDAQAEPVARYNRIVREIHRKP